MKLKEIEAKIGTLSNPAKMPSFAWGIPIEYCVTGSKLAKVKGTICNKCYAGKGCYVFPVVRAMYEKRYQKYKNKKEEDRYHRWFDSGDVQSYSHLMKIFEVCELTPHIKYWLATREYQIIAKIKEKDVPKNLCLRVSTTKVDSPQPKFWKWTSGVHKDKKAIGHECPSQTQDNKCGSCRACWSRKVKQVSYEEH
jgi:hypothetical protein